MARTCWRDRPSGEEVFNLMEEKVPPALSRCLERFIALDECLLVEMEVHAAVSVGAGADAHFPHQAGLSFSAPEGFCTPPRSGTRRTPGTLSGPLEQPMDSRRLVVWLSAGILGFQGGTLVLDLIHCSVLSWLYIRRYGLEQVVPSERLEQRPPEGLGKPEGLEKLEGLGRKTGLSEQASQAQAHGQSQPQPLPPALASASQPSSPQPSPRAVPLDPTEVFCSRPRSRVDTAVGQGLSILAGLALGGSVGGGKSEP
jgi:hypothetical protein